MTTAARSRAEGFSLIELMVAMVVTLIVTGAIYGLLAGGQTAFRKEPELAERQQNIRVAMALIQNDINTAGVGMGSFFKVFQEGLNSAGPQGTTAKTDYLQFFGNDGSCPDVDTLPWTADCINGGGNKCPTNGANLNTGSPIPGCYQEDSLLLVIYGKNGQEVSGKFGVGHNIHSGDDNINFPGGQQDAALGSQILSNQQLECLQPPCDATDAYPLRMSAVNIYRYEIANDPDGVPCLWRSTTGGMDPAGGAYVPAPNVNGRWQLVARGIEDLQVRYRIGDGKCATPPCWVDDPGTPADPDYGTVVRELRVTLSARSTAPNLTGQTTAVNQNIGAAARDAVRGALTSTTAVRASLFYMSQAGQWQ